MKIWILFFLFCKSVLNFKLKQNVSNIYIINREPLKYISNKRNTSLLAHTNKNFRKLGRDRAQRRALLRALTTSLLRYGKIVTTEAKAKETRRKVDRIITYAKKHDNNRQYAYRLIANYVYDRELALNVVKQAPVRYKERHGGYTKIKLLPKSRKGDASRMAMLELL
ncbi:50S ribosomal protein L17, apicoplast, putative [Plasmodium reichenowi]|uniref:50S ribosomal protein L17, apicoplast, putative n=1 Tax=Plasmodium reichenowi TaxID=5854 RepID=A0A060RPE6_PLARE|nr:50S ribosomal protein L17, apicoplast, putative [Plasmodium reichenowi]KYO01625.1 50S ribosomal protein L17, apicoplast, putative [Plasmodium reichenowi]CDO63103.1 50S ribosomal protein L17, apicoplast, putative [Plasmodium reichenowi]SOV76869.1 50S ribosomal protein L17, apicoplast, putative [Plasmodium reichenowi]